MQSKHIEFLKHLEERGFQSDTFAWVDFETEIVVFPIYTIDGRLVGYENYNWRVTDKTIRNKPNGRYFKFITDPENAAWGFYHIVDFTKPLYVVEGVWDAERVRATGRNCIAVMQNNPKRLASLFKKLESITVAICDGDGAGRELAKNTDLGLFLDDGLDPNDLPVEELERVLSYFELEHRLVA
ncbi:hypothetical protein [Photobacterium damselae]|uniref:hypothetical protein n=1 Tax=Photobacterium damselae TaxID=38293 RepID=UPI001F422EE1|nr:hypothetical protein [Photobacterium damselae]UKA04827.1 hypothetical protein IHC89_21530 [Photobacterium damselae subsp. damselae]